MRQTGISRRLITALSWVLLVSILFITSLLAQEKTEEPKKLGEADGHEVRAAQPSP